VHDGDVTPIFVDINAGWRLAQRARAQADDESAAGRELGAAGSWFVAMPNVKRPAPAQILTEQAVAAQYANPERERLVGRDMIAGKAPGDVGDTLYAGADGTWEAHRDADGMVRWHRVEPQIGTVTTAGGTRFVKVDSVENVTNLGALDEIDKSAVENVWQATALADLAETFRIYTEVCGREWGGRVAEAAEARRRQIECPQRTLHAGSGKCACGWVTGVPA
jgi:hypothetical protein